MQQPRCISHTEDMQILAVLILYSDCKFYYKCTDTTDMDTCNQTLWDKINQYSPPGPGYSFKKLEWNRELQKQGFGHNCPPRKWSFKREEQSQPAVTRTCLKRHVGTRMCSASIPLSLSIRSILPSSSVTIALGVIPLPPLLIWSSSILLLTILKWLTCAPQSFNPKHS